MNNKLKKIRRGVICLSILIGSSMVIIVPANALNDNKIVIKSDIKSQDIIDEYKKQINIYIEKAENDIDNNNMVQGEKDANIALGYIDKITDNIIKKDKPKKISEVMDNVYEYQANDYLRKAVINLGNNKLNESENDLIIAFNNGNKISDSLIRQPIINMIIKIQNQINI